MCVGADVDICGPAGVRAGGDDEVAVVVEGEEGVGAVVDGGDVVEDVGVLEVGVVGVGEGEEAVFGVGGEFEVECWLGSVVFVAGCVGGVERCCYGTGRC